MPGQDTEPQPPSRCPPDAASKGKKHELTDPRLHADPKSSYCTQHRGLAAWHVVLFLLHEA